MYARISDDIAPESIWLPTQDVVPLAKWWRPFVDAGLSRFERLLQSYAEFTRRYGT